MTIWTYYKIEHNSKDQNNMNLLNFSVLFLAQVMNLGLVHHQAEMTERVSDWGNIMYPYTFHITPHEIKSRILKYNSSILAKYT